MSDPAQDAPVASTEEGRRLAELLDKMTPEPWEVCGGYTPAFSAIKSPGGLIVWAMADRAAKDMHGRPIEAPDYETQRANIGGIALLRNLARRLLSDSARLAASEARCREDERDATRYRYLRDPGLHGLLWVTDGVSDRMSATGERMLGGDELDAEVDAGLAAEAARLRSSEPSGGEARP